MEIACQQAGGPAVGLPTETYKANGQGAGAFAELVDLPAAEEIAQDGEFELALSDLLDADAPERDAEVVTPGPPAVAIAETPAPEAEKELVLVETDFRLRRGETNLSEADSGADTGRHPHDADPAQGQPVEEMSETERQASARDDAGKAGDLEGRHRFAAGETPRGQEHDAKSKVPVRGVADQGAIEESALAVPVSDDQGRLADGAESRLDPGLPDQGTVSVSLLSGRPPPEPAHGLPDRHVRTAVVDAQNVLGQISDKLAEGQKDVVEITLSPEELGKVRLVIVAGEKPSVAVHAERLETFELLRRNADALQKELREAGLPGADLSFSGGGERRERQAVTMGRGANPSCVADTAFLAAGAAPAVRPGMARQIDIRI
ncbi:flagellar hook-length control protein FliK [Paracoccus sp. TOH]|uniref:flagellar hook-length control protein FliK n=1 Tax=Paracoccus sp. TOH TaxID=1263728 RepID=UPI0025B14334|nr:flagellar hook-length control protein FliK [Paracoccus sp. TOH]WJS83850.1 flagellar hook-length control protein FliK [Paracoccus sp. TOH]